MTARGAASSGVLEPPLAPDYVLAGYLLLTGALAAATLTGTGLALAGAHALGLAGIAWLSRRPIPRPAPLQFLRIALPVLLTPVLYTELETLNQLVNPGYLDETVQAWEAVLFGVQLSVEAARELPHPWLSELLHLGYFSYYLVVPIAAVAAFRAGGAEGLERFTVTVALGFFLCYLVFAVFPVAGPRYLFPRIEGPPAQGLMFELVHTVLEAGSSKGTAFPSSHIAASGAALLAAGRESRRWFWILVVPVVLLVLGTVYGRFHYGVDALAGLVVAFLAAGLTPALIRRVRRVRRVRPRAGDGEGGIG